MQVIEHNEVPEVEAPELPAPQPGQYSICMLISLKHHFKTSQLETRESNGKSLRLIGRLRTRIHYLCV